MASAQTGHHGQPVDIWITAVAGITGMHGQGNHHRFLTSGEIKTVGPRDCRKHACASAQRAFSLASAAGHSHGYEESADSLIQVFWNSIRLLLGNLSGDPRLQLGDGDTSRPPDLDGGDVT